MPRVAWRVKEGARHASPGLACPPRHLVERRLPPFSVGFSPEVRFLLWIPTALPDLERGRAVGSEVSKCQMDLYPLNADRVTDITDIRAIATYLQKVYNKHPDSLGGAARRRTRGAAEGLRRRPLAAVGVVCRFRY